LYFLICVSIAISLSIIASFFDNPALKKQGKLIYYSTLFVAGKEEKGIIKIHGGSLFDYVFVIDKTLSAKQRINFILQKYLEGILSLIAKRKLSFPKLTTIRTFESTVEELIKRREFIEGLNDKLKNTIALRQSH
jgi:hypothetical protein